MSIYFEFQKAFYDDIEYLRRMYRHKIPNGKLEIEDRIRLVSSKIIFIFRILPIKRNDVIWYSFNGNTQTKRYFYEKKQENKKTYPAKGLLSNLT